MGRVGVENLARDQPFAAGQFDDLVKDLLIDVAIQKAPPTRLAQRRGIRNFVLQAQMQEPAIGGVDLYLAHQLAFAANTEQVSDEQKLEQHHRSSAGRPLFSQYR